MERRGTPFRGVLFAGLMLTEAGAMLIEFNVRFGDPECQVLMARLQSDLLPALLAACEGELDAFELRFRDEAACGVVMAARGYPEAPETGSEIHGLAEAAAVPGALVFHAGTRMGGAHVLGGWGPGADCVRDRGRCGGGSGAGVCGGGCPGLARGVLPAR